MYEDEHKIIAELSEEDEVTRKKYTGYGSQKEWQKDLKKYVNEEICGAMNKQKKMCKKRPMENGRCRNHGGATPKGVQHHNYKHGGYSKYLPKALLEKYKEADSNEDLLSLREEMALITTRLYELSEMVNDTAGKTKYKELVQKWRDWHRAKANDSNNAPYIKTDLDELIEEIEKDLKIWDEVGEMVNLKRKLVDSEQRKLNNLQQYVPTEKVMLLMGALMDIVVTEIEDLEGTLMDDEMVQKTITAVARKFRNISNKDPESYNQNGA